MVRISDKQQFLEDVETAIIAALLVETKLKIDFTATVDTWHPNDDFDDSDDEEIDHAVSRALITTHSIISND